jgi:hypothetical protein
MTEALRSFGGVASQAEVSVHIVCPSRRGRQGRQGRQAEEERPAVIPPENDHEK